MTTVTGLVYYAMDATRRALYLKIGYTTDLRNRVANLRGTTGSGLTPPAGVRSASLRPHGYRTSRTTEP
jgi:predicted GIY-YIG superfamily endonuclease